MFNEILVFYCVGILAMLCWNLLIDFTNDKNAEANTFMGHILDAAAWPVTLFEKVKNYIGK